MSVQEDLTLPGVVTFLPILYIAWADAVLTASEIEEIRKSIHKQPWLNENEKEVLEHWMDPKNPPSPETMKSWLREIRSLANDMPDEDRKSLADAGMKMANINGKATDRCSTPEACKALYEIEEALGVLGAESLGTILETGWEQPSSDESESFPVDQMTKLLDGNRADLINKVKTIISDPAFQYLEEPSKDKYREKVLDWCKLLADQGFGSLGYPSEYGGQDDLEGYFAVMETLSYHDLSMVIKFGVQFGLFGMSVMFLGTKKHHKKYLKRIGTLELPGCFAMTETGHGSNVRDIETTATYDPNTNSFIINTPNDQARKDYIGNAAKHGRLASVFAQLITNNQSYGVHAFLVPLRDENGAPEEGIRIEDCGLKMGLNGVDNGRIWFDNVRIPAENLLDRFASVDKQGHYSSPINSDSKRFFTMLGTLVGGRIGIPRSGLSASKSALTIAIRYANQRRQFGVVGKPETRIIEYKTHQRRLFPLLANSYALHFALQYLTQRFLNRREEDAREIEALAAGLKAWSTWNTTRTIQECREACGGQGYLAENRFAALKADTDIFTTFEGDNTVLMQLVAKSRLTEFKQEFHEINFFGIIKYIASQAGTRILEKNPIITRRTEKEHLLDPEFHLAAFNYREASLLSSAARRLKHRLDNGMDSFQAFNSCQHHLVSLAKAYVERVILEQFHMAISNVNGDLGGVLQQLCHTYALSAIESDKGWFLEAGYIENSKSKAIRNLVNDLCLQLKPESEGLVNAFNIPEPCLSAPIA